MVIKTKQLTREQRRALKNNKPIPQQDPFKAKTKLLNAQQRASLLNQRKQTLETVKKVDDIFRKGNFSSLREAQQFYNSLPTFIRNRTQENPQKLLERKKEEYRVKIKKLKQQIDKAGDNLSSKSGLQKTKAKASIKGREAEAAFLTDILNNRISKGDFIDFNSAQSRATQIRKQVENEVKLQGFSQLSPQSRGVKLNTIQQPDREKIARAVVSGAFAFKINQESKRAKKEFEDRLGKFGNVLTQKQKNQLFATQFVSTTPFLQLPTKVKKELNIIDKLTLQPLVKERLKREVIGNSVDRLGGQLDLFGKSLTQNRLREQLTKNIRTETIKQLKDKTLAAQYRQLTGQTITPKERARINLDIGKQNKRLTRTQINNLVKVASRSPPFYVENLITRRKNGEKNPLFNDFKSFGVGVGKGLLDIIKGLEPAYNYGKRLSREAQKGNFVLDDDIRLLGRRVKNISKFVKDNPIISAVIVLTAVDKGLSATKREFINKPFETTGRAFAWLFPTKVFTIPRNIALRLSPKYVKEVKGKFVFRSRPAETFKVKGKQRLLKERVQKFSIKRPFKSVSDFLKGRKPGQFRKFTKDPGLILKTQTVASGAKPLSKQAELAGKEITAVNAAAEQLTSWLKRRVIVRKPIPNEAKFPVKVKTLLKKFDSGVKLSTKEFAFVNKWLQKNVAPNITLLERSLYADPDSGFRVSRLGLGKEASLRDILKGNFKLDFGLSKPQVLIFENAKVAKFPKSLKDIERKLKAEKKLTQKEVNRLIAWQVKTGSGKFKPIGSTIYKGGIELEVTLAPGELIKRIKRIGFTLIDGKKINFVTAEVYKAPKSILNKIDKANKGKLTEKEIVVLEKDLSKRLGRKVRVDNPKSTRRFTSDKPILRVRGRSIKVIGRIPRIKRITRTKKKGVRTPTKPTGRKTGTRTGKRVVSARTPPRTSTGGRGGGRGGGGGRTILRTSGGRGGGRGGGGRTPPFTSQPPPTRTIRIKLPKNIKRKGSRQAYLIKIKEGNRIVAQTRTPLPRNRATNLMRRRLDNTVQASGELVPKGKTNIVDVNTRILGGKFREKRSKGTKVLRNVEKRKFRIDRPGEKKGLKKTKRRK